MARIAPLDEDIRTAREQTLTADCHSGNFLSPVIGHEDGGSEPAPIFRKFPGKNESMRRGVVASGKNRSDFVRIAAAIVDVEIEPASFNQNAAPGIRAADQFLEIGARYGARPHASARC